MTHFWDEGPFPDNMTLGEAREKLRGLVDEGHRCPCCSRFAKVYRRKVNSSMARALIVTYRSFGLDFGYLQDVRRANSGVFGADNREESKLRYWELIEEEKKLRPDGGRAGWWRVTGRGEAWVLDRVSIPKYASIYDKRLLQLLGDPVTITDALGSKFNYRELMDGI